VLSRGPGQSRFTLAVLAVISVTILAVDLLGLAPFGIVKDGVNAALSPVRAIGNGIFGSDDSDEVARLEERIAELEGNEIQAANYLAELRRIQVALNLTPPEGVDAVAATIISQSVGNFDEAIEIDVGSRNGVEVNMPVTVGDTLVGVVDSVTINSSRILLISSPEVDVGVKHVPSGEVGVAHGQGDGEPLIVESDFAVSQPVADRDAFVTAGPAGSNFPPGLVVGAATRIQAGDNPLEQLVYIEPTADLDGLSQVAVLLFIPGEAGPAAPEEESG
jgi:rod shape-determining protein MreC